MKNFLNKIKAKRGRSAKTAIIVCVILVAYALWDHAYLAYHPISISSKVEIIYKTQEEKNDVYTRFVMESYDSILENYWFKITEDSLSKLFQLSVQRAIKSTALPELASNDRAGTAKIVYNTVSGVSDMITKKQLAVDMVSAVLYNLQPIGRNALYSEKQEVALRQNVSNINPNNDLYKNLGVEKGAPVAVVEKAYKEKEIALAKIETPEAKEELKKITYAKKVLTDESSKQLYDEAQIEPTVTGKIFGNTLYLSMSKISPTTLREFGIIVSRASTTPRLDSMVIDMRGNIGGALDFLQYFLGAFIGHNQYAFDLFHQDEYNVQRTLLDKYEPLSRYKELAILTDNMTQSTAELTAAVFKKFHLAKIIGSTTRGWGTIENTYPISTQMDETEKYTLFLVNSVTLRDDNQPIEGRGVTPDIDIKSPTFNEDLLKSIRNSSLVKTVEERMGSAPLR